MKERLILRIRPKVFKNIILALVGLLGVYFGIYYLLNSWWWIFALLIGGFVAYTSIDALFFPRTLMLLIDDVYLYVIFSRKRGIKEKQEEINNGGFYTGKYKLSKIENIWRYKLSVNLSTAYEVINIIYKGKKVQLIDIGGDFRLKKRDFETILNFFVKHAPQIKIGKPPYARFKK